MDEMTNHCAHCSGDHGGKGKETEKIMAAFHKLREQLSESVGDANSNNYLIQAHLEGLDFLWQAMEDYA